MSDSGEREEAMNIGVRSSTRRKVFGLPLSVVLLLCLLAVSALGVIVVFDSVRGLFSMATPLDITSTIPTTLSGFAGGAYNYSWSATNNANRALNTIVRATINESSLTTGEAKVTIKDGAGVVLASSSTVGVNNTISVDAPAVDYASGQTIVGSVLFEFNSTADPSNYSVAVLVVPGPFTFQ